jgi:uncharacterized SAM-binding protein YcdF (DUF218 family)
LRTLALLLIIVCLWGVGLWAFANRVAASTPAPDPPQADAIVALTGASVLRLEAATELLEEGLADRLLISGVNRQATRDQVRATLKTAGRAFDCCVDLGFNAENTRGNASETAQWVRYHHYKTLIVVTADFHMPRAILELHAAMPGVRLYPYPVQTGTLEVKGWWRRPGDARRMTVEYCKYLAILTRNAVLGLARHHGHSHDNLATDGKAA